MGMYVSQDPIGLAGGILNLYGYVSDTNSWVDIIGLSSQSYSGDKGKTQAKADLQRNNLTLIGEEVTLDIHGKIGTGNIRADLVAVDNQGNIHVFEAKNGNSKYTQNQINANVYDKSRLANTTNGTLDLTKGKTAKANIATQNKKKTDQLESNYIQATGNNQISFSTGTTHTITLHTVWYNL